jgi:uncharacterized membrane protein YccF (DUF307 family)
MLIQLTELRKIITMNSPSQQQTYPTQPPVMVQNYYQQSAPPPVAVNVERPGPNFLLRVLWFILIGWWLGLIWLIVGYVLCVTIILLPIGLAMLNRLPQILTLRPVSQHTTVFVSTGTVKVNVEGQQQLNFLLRAIYFVCIGFWFGFIWALTGYILCVTIVLMPVGLVMLNRLPAVLTLRRN